MRPASSLSGFHTSGSPCLTLDPSLNFRAAYHGRGVESGSSSLTMPTNFRGGGSRPDAPPLALRAGKDVPVRPFPLLSSQSPFLRLTMPMLYPLLVLCVRFLICATPLPWWLTSNELEWPSREQSRNLHFVVPDSVDQEHASTGSDSFKLGQEAVSLRV